MINMDDPRHARLRRIVAKGFTPKMIAQVEDYVRERGRRRSSTRCSSSSPTASATSSTEIAAPLPLQIICDMMGIPASDDAADLRRGPT